MVEDQQRLGWFRFTHALVAEALYETTGRLRRARLHRRIGAAADRAWAGNAVWAAERFGPPMPSCRHRRPDPTPRGRWRAVPAADNSDAQPAKEAAQW